MKNNPFKDLWIAEYYPVNGHVWYRLYQLDDLGNLSRDSHFGNIDELRTIYGEFKLAIARGHKIVKTNHGCMISCNNGWLFLCKASCLFEAMSNAQMMLEKR